MVNAYSNNYLESQIKSASPEQLLIMFYDGAIRFTSQATQAIHDKNIEKRNYFINKACAIVTELNATLDHDIGGKVSEDLSRLYDFMLRELHKANSNNNAKNTQTVEKLLTDLRDTWRQAIDINKKVTVPKAPSQHRPLSVSL